MKLKVEVGPPIATEPAVIQVYDYTVLELADLLEAMVNTIRASRLLVNSYGIGAAVVDCLKDRGVSVEELFR